MSAEIATKRPSRFASIVDAMTSERSSRIGILAFRWVVVACEAATLFITWPLWQVRPDPPLLPAMPLPQLDTGIALLISLAIVLIRPTVGVMLHTGLIAYALLADQTRLQPEIVSLVFLLWGSLPLETGKTFARWHLVSMWTFAGINKLLSPAFLNGTAQWILTGLVKQPPAFLLQNIGYFIAGSELALGLLALFPRTRWLAAVGAFLLHVGILVDLSPLGHNWNQAVWPWNVALAFSGFALIASWKGSPVRGLVRCRPLARAAVALVALSPIGFYFGVTDAYLAHNLYTSNTPSAQYCPAGRGCAGDLASGASLQAFNVPFPPEHRLFEAYFARTCQPGDRLVIRDQRAWAKLQRFDQREIACPAPTPLP